VLDRPGRRLGKPRSRRSTCFFFDIVQNSYVVSDG
jgi:hypothetical protein